MHKINLIAALALAILPTPALAADWVETGKSIDSQTIMWVDAKSIMRSQDGAIFWTRTTRDGGGYFVSQIAARCGAVQYKDLRIMSYDKGGNSMDLGEGKEWKFAVPDSLLHGAIEAVCAASEDDK